MSQPQFKAIVWDLGQVAFFFPMQPWLDAWRHVPRVDRALKSVFAGDDKAVTEEVAALQREFETGRFDHDEHRRALSAAFRLHPPLSPAEYEHGYLRAETITLNTPLFAAQEQIAGLGVAQAVVSNLCPVWRRVLDLAGATRHFDVELYSYVEEIVKPDEELAVRAIDRLAVRAEDAVFIDDLAANLAPAAACGAATHRYEGNDELAAWLASAGFPRICWKPLTRGRPETFVPRLR